MTVAQDGLRPAEPDPDGATKGWLTPVTVTNTGFATVRGADFAVPLAFRFPGREVCGISIWPGSGSLYPRRQPQALPAATGDPGRRTAADSGQGSGVLIGRKLLLQRNGAFTLLALLRGMPASGFPPVSQEGSLSGGTIVAARPHGSFASRWGTACACAAVLLAAILLGMLLGAGS